MPDKTPGLDEHLLALYTIACAPLSGDTLINDLQDLEPDDFTVGAALDEIRFVKGLTSAGFSLITDAFDSIPQDLIEHEGGSDGNRANEVSAALLATASFARRMAALANGLYQMTMNAVDRLPSDPTVLIRELETRAKQGERPIGTSAEALQPYFDLIPNAKWGMVDVPFKNRVGFKETAAVISDVGVEEKALKVTEGGRRKQRNPTGFHRFNFKDLGLEESDLESEGPRSRGGSVRSTDGGSTRGSIGGLGDQRQPLGFMSRSASSGVDEDDLDDNFTLRSTSTVGFSFDKEREIIQDEVADPQWDEQQRHERRYSRIRNRVPTGHPALMKNPSDELAGIVSEYERSLSAVNLDSETAENTETNKRIEFDEAAAAAAAAAKRAMPEAQKRNVTIAHE